MFANVFAHLFIVCHSYTHISHLIDLTIFKACWESGKRMRASLFRFSLYSYCSSLCCVAMILSVVKSIC